MLFPLPAPMREVRIGLKDRCSLISVLSFLQNIGVFCPNLGVFNVVIWVQHLNDWYTPWEGPDSPCHHSSNTGKTTGSDDLCFRPASSLLYSRLLTPSSTSRVHLSACRHLVQADAVEHSPWSPASNIEHLCLAHLGWCLPSLSIYKCTMHWSDYISIMISLFLVLVSSIYSLYCHLN